MSSESYAPFAGDLKTLDSKDGFDIHKLDIPQEVTAIPEGEIKEFKQSEYLTTEYFSSNKNRTHESFVQLKSFYDRAEEELGEFLPKTFFVEGEPSKGRGGQSFYVVQKFDRPELNQKSKKLDELNLKEFSIDLINQLLEVQERINHLLESYSWTQPPNTWLDEQALDPKMFKEDLIFSPVTGEIQLTGLFNLSPDLAKSALGSTGKFEPSEERLTTLKLLGFASLAEKIDHFLERSAVSEWIKGVDVHWSLNKEKLKSEGKKAMALTFDDGPNPETEKLLDILKEKGVKATFFVVGSLVEGNEHIVRRIIEEGHDIGVHEWGQEGAPLGAGLAEYGKRFVGPRRDLGDVKRTTELIERVAGVRPVLGRMAGIHMTVDSLREFQAMDLELVLGSPRDILAIPTNRQIRAEALLKKALGANGQGRIRVFHIGIMKGDGLETQRSEIDTSKGEVYPPDEVLKMMGDFIDQRKVRDTSLLRSKSTSDHLDTKALNA